MTTTINFSIATAVLAISLVVASAGAQNHIITDMKTAKQLISGKAERAWIAQAVKAPLGGTSCEEGLRYLFRADDTAEVHSCVDGSWDTKKMSWSISGGGNDILNVVLDDTTYEATLEKHPDHLELILKTPATSKIVNILKIVMTYTLD